jgi:hypothetical protein
MLILQRATIPRFASDIRMSRTAEEGKAVVQGSIDISGLTPSTRPRAQSPSRRWQHLPELGWRYPKTTGVRFQQRGQLLGDADLAILPRLDRFVDRWRLLAGNRLGAAQSVSAEQSSYFLKARFPTVKTLKQKQIRASGSFH